MRKAYGKVACQTAKPAAPQMSDSYNHHGGFVLDLRLRPEGLGTHLSLHLRPRHLAGPFSVHSR